MRSGKKYYSLMPFCYLNLVQDNYKPVGCYSFKEMKKKLKIFGKKAYKNTKATSEKPLDQCIPDANENNYDIIGIQKIKENIICRKGNKEPDASIEKLDLKNCKNKVGSKKTIFIYRNPGKNKLNYSVLFKCALLMQKTEKQKG